MPNNGAVFISSEEIFIFYARIKGKTCGHERDKGIPAFNRPKTINRTERGQGQIFFS